MRRKRKNRGKKKKTVEGKPPAEVEGEPPTEVTAQGARRETSDAPDTRRETSEVSEAAPAMAHLVARGAPQLGFATQETADLQGG